MSKIGITPSAGRKPRVRTVLAKSVVMALDGPEQAYPVYQFSGRRFVERPFHNPFGDIAPDSGNEVSAWGTGFGTAFGDGFG